MRVTQRHGSVEEAVTRFFRQHRLSARKPLVVAVSGGPDSVCLLHVLHSLRKELGLKLHVAHLDHMLRGEQSVGDAQYVLDLCHRLGVPVTVEQRDVRAYAREERLTFEEAAREVRYRFFADVAESVGGQVVAVGHTLDDHVETVLLHIIRGAGTTGLQGLRPVSVRRSNGAPLTVVRPLVQMGRSETEAYCRRHRLQPRLDATNLSPEFLRNRVRLELLPLLKTYNPRIVEALARTARIAGEDMDVLQKLARRHWRGIVRQEGSAMVLDRAGMLRLPPGIQRLLLRMALDGMLGTLKDIEQRHIEEMIDALSKPAGKTLHLPYGLRFAVEHSRFILAREPEEASPFPALEGEHKIAVPGVTLLPGWRITVRLVPAAQRVSEDPFTAVLDRDRVEGALSVRPRRPADRFQPLGMNEQKKVGRFMIDAHIPQSWRARVPIVCDGDELVWVAGYRIDERVKVTPATKRALRISFERAKS